MSNLDLDSEAVEPERKPVPSKPSKPVSPAPKEPKQENVRAERPSPAGAKPSPEPTRKRVKDSVVGAGDTDTVAYSKARMPRATEGRKSLTVLHVQRALAAEGIPTPPPTGRYDASTEASIIAYQASRKEPETGLLTRDQFRALFEGDPNVNVVVDTYEDLS